MQLADCSVIIGKFGDTVPRTNVTPAEAQFLIHEHMKLVGKVPVINLKITGEEAETPVLNPDGTVKVTRKRTNVDEKQRLKSIYDSNPVVAKNKVEQLYPGTAPALPQTFAEVVDLEGNTVFDAKGSSVVTNAADEVTIGGKAYTQHELAQLVAAGEAALKVKHVAPAKASGSKKDQDKKEEEEDKD